MSNSNTLPLSTPSLFTSTSNLSPPTVNTTALTTSLASLRPQPKMLAQTKLHITAQLAHQASVISLCNRLTGVESKIQEALGSVRRRIFGHITSSQRIKICDELNLLKAVIRSANIQQEIIQTSWDELKGSQEWLTENENVKDAITNGFDCVKNMLEEGGHRLNVCWRWWMDEAVKETR